VLVIEDVVKTYKRGRVRANDGVSLTVGAGEVVGVLGPNGAGKTTVVRQLLGLTEPDAGRINVDGVDVVADPAAARRLCSYQPQAQIPINGLKPRRVIELLGRLRGGDRAEVIARGAALLERLDITGAANKAIQDVSGGVARLVAFCAAIVVPGKVVVLDEPTNDVDPLRRRVLWELVREVADAGSAVLLVTHNVHEAERAVDSLVIMDGGRVVAAGRPSDLRRGRSATPLRLEVVAPSAIDAPSFLVEPTRAGERLRGGISEDDVDAALAWCRARRADGVVEEFALSPMTLEDVYADVVGGPA